jgi:hypothetical protein
MSNGSSSRSIASSDNLPPIGARSSRRRKLQTRPDPERRNCDTTVAEVARRETGWQALAHCGSTCDASARRRGPRLRRGLGPAPAGHRRNMAGEMVLDSIERCPRRGAETTVARLGFSSKFHPAGRAPGLHWSFLGRPARGPFALGRYVRIRTWVTIKVRANWHTIALVDIGSPERACSDGGWVLCALFYEPTGPVQARGTVARLISRTPRVCAVDHWGSHRPVGKPAPQGWGPGAAALADPGSR